MKPLLVITSLPDAQSARGMAGSLIEERLAACVNILAPCQSVYRWKGELEEAQEVPLLIKTTEECYPALEAAIHQYHPYDLPEIIALPIERGLPEYLIWLGSETTQNDA